MYTAVSSETGVSRGLAALALLQHAKLQRPFLGAVANRGNTRGMWSCATRRQLIRLLSKLHCLHVLAGTPLLFFSLPVISTYTLNLHAQPPLMFMFLPWRQTLPALLCSVKEAAVLPKSPTPLLLHDRPQCAVFLGWPS